MNRVPMPGRAKTFSVMIAPPRSVMTSIGTIVASGISVLRNPWRMMTVRSGRPLARAVRM
ncbi:hypothetical protein D3C74_479290 [compost metagenome]